MERHNYFQKLSWNNRVFFLKKGPAVPWGPPACPIIIANLYSFMLCKRLGALDFSFYEISYGLRFYFNKLTRLNDFCIGVLKGKGV